MGSNIITLTSDWGNSAYYAAIFKAYLFRENSALQIIDVSHEVKMKRIMEAAFIVKSAYAHFPIGSIHIIDVDDIPTTQKRNEYRKRGDECNFVHFLAFKYNGHYFLCQNNGIISLLCDDIENLEAIIRLSPVVEYTHLSSFLSIAYFVKPSVELAQGRDLLSLGTSYPKAEIESAAIPKPILRFSPDGNGDSIILDCQYVDSYGNIITNLDRETYEKIAKGRRSFSLYHNSVGEIGGCTLSETYNEALDKERICIFSHSGFLEIGIPYTPLAPILKMDNPKTSSWQLKLTFNT